MAGTEDRKRKWQEQKTEDGRTGTEDRKRKVLKYLILLEQEILAGWN